jgi:hypothetical protein
MLGGKIEINQFQNHIDHTYPVGHWVQVEWQRIKNDIAEALKPSHNSDLIKLLCDIKTLLLDVDTPTREQRSDIVHRIANVSVAQLH